MERARAWLAVGAVAVALTAASLGATATPSRDLTSDLALVAARDVMPAPKRTPPPADEKPAVPTADPVVVGDPHGGMGGPPSPDPMDMDGHGQEASPGASPGAPDGHADASPMPADDHGTGMDGSPTPVDDHGTTDVDDHDDDAADDGHGDEGSSAERPRELVLGGFGLLNALVFAAAALLRRRDRAAAARKAAARIEPASSSPTDAPR